VPQIEVTFDIDAVSYFLPFFKSQWSC
jgi:hypothetical protein